MGSLSGAVPRLSVGTAMGVLDMLVMVAVAAVAALLTAAASRSWPEWQRRWAQAALGFHVFCCIAQVALTRFVFRGGDIDVYFRYGHENAQMILQEPGRYVPQLFGMLAQQSTSLAGFGGGSTISMVGLTTLALFPAMLSFMGACMIFGVCSFSGKLALYKSLELFVHPIVRKRLFFACMFIPSMVFWSSAIMKESVAICALGWVVWAIVSLWVKRRSPLVFAIGGVAIWVLAMNKAYVLISLAISLGVWAVWWTALKKGEGAAALLKKPLNLLGGVAAAAALLAVVGTLAPRYAPSAVFEEASYLQEVGQRVSGGSKIAGVGDLSSTSGQLQAIPIALVTTLFRPFIFEAHNAVAFVNALETTGVLLLFMFVLVRRGIVQIVRTVLSTPALMFCVTFTLTFAVGVGVSTTNLGTMSRYRTPMLPFYFAALLLLYPVRAPRRADASPP